MITARGEVTLYHLSVGAYIQLLTEGRVLSDIPCTIIVNPYIDEVLLSDYVIDELGIIAVGFRKGEWRHRNDLPSIIRESVPPEYW